MESEHPRVGVGVIVRKGEQVLLGRRIGAHGAHTWAFPGGHLELYEDVFECARRETKEETGLQVRNLRLGPYTNDIMRDEAKHYVTVYVLADHVVGDPVVCEPDKCAEWRWCSWNDLPAPLFLPLRNLVSSGYIPH